MLDAGRSDGGSRKRRRQQSRSAMDVSTPGAAPRLPVVALAVAALSALAVPIEAYRPPVLLRPPRAATCSRLGLFCHDRCPHPRLSRLQQTPRPRAAWRSMGERASVWSGSSHRRGDGSSLRSRTDGAGSVVGRRERNAAGFRSNRPPETMRNPATITALKAAGIHLSAALRKMRRGPSSMYVSSVQEEVMVEEEVVLFDERTCGPDGYRNSGRNIVNERDYMLGALGGLATNARNANASAAVAHAAAAARAAAAASATATESIAAATGTASGTHEDTGTAPSWEVADSALASTADAVSTSPHDAHLISPVIRRARIKSAQAAQACIVSEKAVDKLAAVYERYARSTLRASSRAKSARSKAGAAVAHASKARAAADALDIATDLAAHKAARAKAVIATALAKAAAARAKLTAAQARDRAGVARGRAALLKAARARAAEAAEAAVAAQEAEAAADAAVDSAAEAAEAEASAFVDVTEAAEATDLDAAYADKAAGKEIAAKIDSIDDIRQRRRPHSYWADPQNLLREVQEFWADVGIASNKVPNSTLLLFFKAYALSYGIARTGGREDAAELLGVGFIPGPWPQATLTEEVKQLRKTGKIPTYLLAGPNGGGTELIASSRRNWPSEKALQDGFNASLQRTGARRRINWEIDGNLWKEMSKFNVAMQSQAGLPIVWMVRMTELNKGGRRDIINALTRKGGYDKAIDRMGMVHPMEWQAFLDHLGTLKELKDFITVGGVVGDVMPPLKVLPRGLRNKIVNMGGRKMVARKMNLKCFTFAKGGEDSDFDLADQNGLHFGRFSISFAVDVMEFVLQRECARRPIIPKGPKSPPVRKRRKTSPSKTKKKASLRASLGFRPIAIMLPRRADFLKAGGQTAKLVAKIELFGGYENVARRLDLGYHYSDETKYQTEFLDIHRRDIAIRNKAEGLSVAENKEKMLEDLERDAEERAERRTMTAEEWANKRKLRLWRSGKGRRSRR